MNTRDELASIGRRVVDCRSYNFGMRNADKLAHEDAPRMLAALDAVLAPHQRQPATYGDDDAICMDCGEWWPCHTIQAVNDALEESK